jgi:hypothetical protein
MPKNLDEEARECRRHAKGCAPEAGAQTAFFELQRRWQFLARRILPAVQRSQGPSCQRAEKREMEEIEMKMIANCSARSRTLSIIIMT